ncbi:tRNA (N(6)-L-threonylcarbamoyladenosine(37)-C(2))-methylthiotransferase MtaB [Rhodoblastus acidophilus]|uniref:tRNA (N(6)-L-threonylcarbamoyladenosine(37)-C(2))-methylthiotransferase MtaB n=1 Tax=Candidatus Rhodoblastus alkanivorans TaxID=2954117 RepID=A0ABS9Z3H1_9HYPH|nr:tRNA (N(6)-L-threonylcarbamoyladenosine(37)-C(2))-methylthiotransferase MtaB [Candidatus Rhodoblastus alkanivorans]MCI4677531.1 tRNA (N(6)-L-threonylcarbamoyladenosine(37)-C(2))-methylthiotransferase MtaB [Candidatus Rhodoblastus alkanivorans]MCI4681890.1 tRNA (N(6)-L-threonylcarbamoyladenosine(37)-C(2))-methylthiotransferase MtaB [Candidatus Rhodoblastus alkanivorans]MDI4642940.1 tRNA (N(6)-L-threonylcarbamoyladenosine(37)-C(2))-methylthiotransferase MtaB [Rhodoblastus acidophilus]
MTEKVEVVTFGCRLNLAESQTVRELAAQGGESGLVVVNTCAVTAEATRQARQAIRRMKRERPEARIVVTGCAAQIEPEMFADMPEVAHVMGNAEKTRALSWSHFPNRVNVAPLSDAARRANEPAPVLTAIEGHTRAFLAVQNGCDHDCTFCVIPAGRGRSRSVTPQAALEQARKFVETGHKEIVLTGVDLTYWGSDLPGAPKLGKLVRLLLRELPDLPRLRLSSIDCIEADADLLAAFAEEERLAPYLHLSLQSGDDLILKRMKRRHSRAESVAFCAELRRLRPDIALGADLIAGFPTEDEDAAARSLALIEDCGLSFLHVFPFSPRPGTPAARMPPVAPAAIKARAARLREAGEQALARHLAAQAGRSLRILTERGFMGRAEDFTPVRTAGFAPGQLVSGVAKGFSGGALEVTFFS